MIDVTLRKHADEPHEMAVTIKDITSEIEEDVKMAALIDEIDSAAGKKLKKRFYFYLKKINFKKTKNMNKKDWDLILLLWMLLQNLAEMENLI